MANGNSGLLSKVREDARGQWRSILSTVAGIPHESLDGRHHPCPKCGGTDRFRAFDDVAETGGVICNQCFNEKNGDGFAAVAWSLGLPFYQSLLKVADHVHTDQSKRRREARGEPEPHPRGKVVATYSFHDESGNLLYEKQRIEPGPVGRKKSFSFRSPNGNGGWVKGAEGVRRVLYRLPELLAADPSRPVFLVEGEKKVDALIEWGFVATCNDDGAAKWRSEFTPHLAGRPIIILPDNDAKGREHANRLAKELGNSVAAIKIVELPGLPEKGDIVDWRAAGNTADQLRSLVVAAPAVDPESIPEELPPASTFDPKELADRFLKAHGQRNGERTIRYWRQEFWKWSNGRYRKVRDEALECLVIQYVNQIASRLSRSILSNVMMQLRANEETFLDPAEDAPFWIGDESRGNKFVSMLNGILDVERAVAGHEDALLEHSPKWFSPVRLPYPFEPSAECPTWRAVLQRNMSATTEPDSPIDFDRVNILQEWSGYLLTPSTDQQKFLMLSGDGSNGKSVYCAVVTAMIGKENISAVSLEMFGQRFQLTETLGKLANIVPDCNELDKVAEGYLKQFTSGDRMQFEEKHKAAFSAVPTARLMVVANNLPRFADRSNGIWRRMLLVPFLREVRDEEKVIGMDKAEWWEASGELSGILNWAIEGARRLRQRGRFSSSATCASAVSDYRSTNNPARKFLVDHCISDPSAHVITKELYKKYTTWCEENGHRNPLASTAFGKEIRKAFSTAVYNNKINCFEEGTRQPGYFGIREMTFEEMNSED